MSVKVNPLLIGDSVEILFLTKTSAGYEISDYGVPKLVTLLEGEKLPDDFKGLRIPNLEAQELLKELLKIFGHPEKDATTAELGATKYHLEDMRKIVFKEV